VGSVSRDPVVCVSTAIRVPTQPRAFVDITRAVSTELETWAARDGVLVLFIRHTSASLLIQENTDPDVQADLRDALAAIAPETRAWRHSLEGPDDMPAHVKAMLMPTSLSIPVRGGRLLLGMWQAIYVVEHRTTPHSREVVLSFTGTATSEL
jgi:secondary thiamine-phosphate synthase enzyme